MITKIKNVYNHSIGMFNELKVKNETLIEEYHIKNNNIQTDIKNEIIETFNLTNDYPIQVNDMGIDLGGFVFLEISNYFTRYSDGFIQWSIRFSTGVSRNILINELKGDIIKKVSDDIINVYKWITPTINIVNNDESFNKLFSIIDNGYKKIDENDNIFYDEKRIIFYEVNKIIDSISETVIENVEIGDSYFIDLFGDGHCVIKKFTDSNVIFTNGDGIKTKREKNNVFIDNIKSKVKSELNDILINIIRN